MLILFGKLTALADVNKRSRWHLIVIVAVCGAPMSACTTSVKPVTVVGVEIAGSLGEGEVRLLGDIGASWTRIAAVWWPDVEPVEGQRNWDALRWQEEKLEQSYAQGVQAVLVIRGTPVWAQQYEGVSCGPISRRKFVAFSNFVADLVARYSIAPYHVKYWELGNEPDIDRKLVAPDSLWGCWGDENDTYYGGAYYAEMLAHVYPRIKQVTEDANVLIGGLVLDCDPNTAEGCPDEQRRRPARFLEGILRAGGGAYFDGVSFHAYDYYDGELVRYSNRNFASASYTTGPVSIAKTNYIRELLQQYAVEGKFIMNTETALLCSRCSEPLSQEFELTKASYAAQSHIAAAVIGLRANIWFRLADWMSTSLITTDMTPLPAYTATHVAASILAGATYSQTLSQTTTGNAVQGYVFLRDGKPIWVVWSTDGITQTMLLPSQPARVLDVFGQPVEQSLSDRLELRPAENGVYYVIW